MDIQEQNKHLYQEFSSSYLEKGFSVIPDRYMMKTPAIKGWSDYCFRSPTEEETKSWISNMDSSNIAICLGEQSKVIAIDVDTDDTEILELIRKHLYPSPVEKVGTKGFTRFYRYNGEHTEVFKHNGQVLFELLSSKKKTTIPPSIHPSGSSYRWVDLPLTDFSPQDLPVLPPYNLGRVFDLVRSEFPQDEVHNVKHSSFDTTGRNDALTKLTCKLISEGKELSEAVSNLVEYDKKNHSPPYFSDPEEYRHVHAYTNALKMYSYQLDRLNGIHHRKNEEYETPMIASAVNAEYKEALSLGKSQREGAEKRSNHALPAAQGALSIIQKNILDNSWIKQPDLAFSASLALLSVLTSRKVSFGGLSPNLYVLNISPSGSGKDAPQQMIKKYLVDIGADYYLGAGDYVSDASLMDSLEQKPTRIDIMDEIGGILKTVTSGNSEYNRKMADVLCELYTSSNSKYLGRATAEGTKGSCYRPNVVILGSTTPKGFSEGVSQTAIEKGLLGRFLWFFGRGDSKAFRLKKFPKLDEVTKNFLSFWARFKPEEDKEQTIGNLEQQVYEIPATDKAHARLDEIFDTFDSYRRNADQSDPKLPIISRLYQQMVKVCILHSISRCGMDLPTITDDDVLFGYNTVMYFLDTTEDVVQKYIYKSQNEKLYNDVLSELPMIGESEGRTRQSLSQRTRHMGKKRRTEIIEEMLETGEIVQDIIYRDDRQYICYWRTK